VQDFKGGVQPHLAVEITIFVQDSDEYGLDATPTERDLRDYFEQAGVVAPD
jgi:hypothetical protein